MQIPHAYSQPKPMAKPFSRRIRKQDCCVCLHKFPIPAEGICVDDFTMAWQLYFFFRSTDYCSISNSNVWLQVKTLPASLQGSPKLLLQQHESGINCNSVSKKSATNSCHLSDTNFRIRDSTNSPRAFLLHVQTVRVKAWGQEPPARESHVCRVYTSTSFFLRDIGRDSVPKTEAPRQTQTQLSGPELQEGQAEELR